MSWQAQDLARPPGRVSGVRQVRPDTAVAAGVPRMPGRGGAAARRVPSHSRLPAVARTTYDKRQIQPFGEYLPLRGLVGAINKNWTSMVRQDCSRGTEPGVFQMANAKVGLVTCYEAAFDWAVRSEVTDGAQLISVPSNNATFDRSEMTYQQLAMSRVRAVEHSRTVTVPVTSGVSAIIMPDGKITQRTGMFVPASLVQKVPLRSSETPATLMGTLPELVLVLLAAGGLGWAISTGLRARRTGDA